MFTRVLIADDLGSINNGVLAMLLKMGIQDIDQVQYCDDAYLKIKNSFKNDMPYDLLITDLSFKADHREQKYTSGDALAKVVKQEHPELKIIVYSVEDRLQKVRTLVENLKIDAYVCKGRQGLFELAEAIHVVHSGEKYLSPQVKQAIDKKADMEISEYDIALLKELSNGLSQDEISLHFKKKAISPNSLSSIEKTVNRLKIQFKSNNTVHLIAIAKDLGLI